VGDGNLLLRADADSDGDGTVVFHATSRINWLGSDGYVLVPYAAEDGYDEPLNLKALIKTKSRAQARDCMLVNSIEDFDRIRENLTGSYCLGSDIDASVTAKWNGGRGFLPITPELCCIAPTFEGNIDGLGYTIDRLTINSKDLFVGLFGVLGKRFVERPFPVVRNIGLTNVKIYGSRPSNNVGGLAGVLSCVDLSRVYVTGDIVGGAAKSNGDGPEVGGLAGYNGCPGLIEESYTSVNLSNDGRSRSYIGGLLGSSMNAIRRSHSDGTILAGHRVRPPGSKKGCVSAESAGGLVGFKSVYSKQERGLISQSYSTADVLFGCSVGGIAGGSLEKIEKSFATGRIVGGDPSPYAPEVGGIVGSMSWTTSEPSANALEVVSNSFFSGEIDSAAGCFFAGGIVGNMTGGASVKSVFSSASFGGVCQSTAGGIVGEATNSRVTKAYWDKEVGRLRQGGTGNGLSTDALRASLPKGLQRPLWSIEKGVSYPFLEELQFTVGGYTYLPISQRDKRQYRDGKLPDSYHYTSGAAVLTMIARAVSAQVKASGAELRDDELSHLKNAPIDMFWNADKGNLNLGVLKKYVKLSRVLKIDSSISLHETGIVADLVAGRPVMIRGKIRDSSHWMLATAIVRDSVGDVVAVIANDPWTGMQVKIGSKSRRVEEPDLYPLWDWSVDGFRDVSIEIR